MKQIIIGILSLPVLWLCWGGCASNIYQDNLTGTWGGKHIGMTVMDSSITLEYDCAHGTIDEPINPDEQGRFEVTGVHIIEHVEDLSAQMKSLTSTPHYTKGRLRRT